MQLAVRDADLQRIRAARDEAIAKQQIAEGVLTDHKSTLEQSLALAKSREDRATALENEVERLRLRCGELHADITDEEMSVTDVSELRTKIASLKRECKTLEEELPSIEQAYKKAQAAAAMKLATAKENEDQIALLKQGKVRADQKYFGIMKHKEQLESEIIVLRRSEKTSSGIISSLKDADAKTKELAVNLERQNAEHMDTIERIVQDRHALDQKAAQASMAAAGYQNQLLKLKEALGEKDSTVSALESTGRESQREVEALKVRLEDQTKKTEEWRKKANSSSSDEVIRLRVRFPLLYFILQIADCFPLACCLLPLQPKSERHRHFSLWPHRLQAMRG
jgi:E3 ubiquitin-protein ligase BRE1